MTRVLRRALAAAVGCALLAGCSSVVVGKATPGPKEPTNVSAGQLPITGAADDQVDQDVRNAITDLQTYWSKEFPEFFGKPFQPLSGGLFSVDPNNIDPSTYPNGIGCGQKPSAVENNAFFCAGAGVPNSDSISYDRDFLGSLGKQYGRSLIPFVLAHEFGHAIQFRFGFNGPSINKETQADCFAGAFTSWAVHGNAQHVAFRLPELDDVIRGYLTVADPAGTDPNNRQAHGSYFDRVSAIAEGYDGGVGKCRDDFGSDRLFTAAEFNQQNGGGTQGNAPYPMTLQITGDTLSSFWQQVFPTAFHKQFQQPQIKPFNGNPPDCAGLGGGSPRQLGYCQADGTVWFDEKDLTKPAYQKIGDFAVVTAISLPYAIAVRSELGMSTDDAQATESAVCLTGWYEAQVFNGAFQDVQISPGDIDEAVEFLLTYGIQESVFPNTRLSGFQLLESYRAGFLQGGGPCNVGL